MTDFIPVPAEALTAAKEAMRGITPPPGVSKKEWLAEHGSWALFAGAISAAAPLIAAQALRDAANGVPVQPAGPPVSAAEAQPVELGYLCSHGHFIFHDDPDVDYACGTKRIADIIIQPVEGAYRTILDGALDEARTDFGRAIGRAYGGTR
jgi:hypothetical protein